MKLELSIENRYAVASLYSVLWMIPFQYAKVNNPIESAYFHYSHLKGKQDYGHQKVGILLSCNGITLPYTIIMYDKTKTKTDIVKEIAEELPIVPHKSYLLCDSWYVCDKIMDVFLAKGFC